MTRSVTRLIAAVLAGIFLVAGIVHVNDSLAPGPDSRVSVDVFDQAWPTSDHSMVLAG